MSLIYWHTMLFVYILESNPQFGPRIKEIHSKMQRRGDSLCTSIFTVGEVLTAPYRRGNRALASQIRDYLQPPAVEILPFTLDVADRYAQIRAVNRITPADAIHLASAAVVGVNLFLTNDQKVAKLTIPGIDFVAGLDVNLF